MASQPTEQFTELLEKAQQGDSHAAGQIFPMVYDELRALARRRMEGERCEHTLQPTALVHEAYVRLVGGKGIHFANRRHFFFAAAQAMRSILIDHARAKSGPKRGGRRRIPLNDVLDLACEDASEEILALDEAISRLEETSPTVGAVVRLRFYGGLSVEETASALGLSPRTVKREWTYARAALFRALQDDDP
jgi:RNA polymerase sigma-70 factor, ECF subfamily